MALPGGPPHLTERPILMSATNLFRAIAAVSMLVVGAACSSDDDQPDEPAPEAGGDSAVDTDASDAVAEPATDASEPDESDAVQVELRSPSDVLESALESLGSSYAFESEIIVNGERASLAIGRHVDGAIEVDLEQEGTTLVYRSVGGERWILAPGGTWEQLGDDATPIDPLDGLRTPTNLSIDDESDDTVTLRATYAAGVLSLPESGDITVSMSVVGGVLANIDFSGDISGRAVELHTTFAPAPDAEPVLPPEPGT